MARKAFTLAEVLITLAIIGVVAALTIPTVIRNYQERETVSALKKFYSQISQAFKLAEVENGALSTWNWGTSSYNNETSADIYKLVAPHLKILKYCNTAQTGCFGAYYKQLNEEPWSSGSAAVDWGGRAKARLADGMSFWIANYTNEACETTQGCGEIFVDLNGNKAPNTLGRDAFVFSVMKNGIIRPWGGSSCSKKYTGWAAGYGCAAWVLRHDNLDYLHKEISW